MSRALLAKTLYTRLLPLAKQPIKSVPYFLSPLTRTTNYYHTGKAPALRNITATMASGQDKQQAANISNSADIDMTQFTKTIPLTALRIPSKQTSNYLKLLRGHLFTYPRMKSTEDIPNQPEWKLLLLREGLKPDDFDSIKLGASTENTATTLKELIEGDSLSVEDTSVEIGYRQLSAGEILRRLLPPEIEEVPTSFETIGHVAHMNLRDEVLPWKHVIGRVILDKNPRIKTAVNKLGSIENEWRVFDMEVLAGSEDTETEVRQHGLRFKLDFRRVYWNSRLETEHQRLVGLFKPGQVILDVMGGIGPFVIPAAHKGCLVMGNDLNPDSYKYLVENIKLNKMTQRAVPYCLDGRELIRLAASGKLKIEKLPGPSVKNNPKKKKQEGSQGVAAAEGGDKPPQKALVEFDYETNPCFDHVVMNLPASAVEFLDAFKGAFDPAMWAGRSLPMVHVYTFARGDETEKDIKERVEAALGGTLEKEPEIFCVRDVAPNKQMFCVSFEVPAAIAFAAESGGEKRQRVE